MAKRKKQVERLRAVFTKRFPIENEASEFFSTLSLSVLGALFFLYANKSCSLSSVLHERSNLAGWCFFFRSYLHRSVARASLGGSVKFMKGFGGRMRR